MTKKLQLSPLGGNILVKPLSEDTVSAAGIVLPDTVDKEKPQKGEVVALGSGQVNSDGNNMPFSVQVGDKVLFKKYSPDEVKMGETEYLIMDEEAILGIIKE